MTTARPSCVVHKFGGTSVANADCFRRVASIVAKRPEPRRVIVVSAMAGVTDDLVRAVHVAGKRDLGYREIVAALAARHRKTVAELLPDTETKRLRDVLDRDLAIIEEVLHVTTVLHGYSRNGLELVSGYGEVWSAQILAALLQQEHDVDWLDAREVLIVTRTETGADVMWPETRARISDWLARRGGLPGTLVVTGFVASTEEGLAATLGRNGSDVSASIFGSLFDAEEIHIWTDVDGVMSANPRLVSEAVTLDSLSYEEAIELAYFGAKVIHPNTISTALERKLPIFIRNTFNPELAGTRIQSIPLSTRQVKGLATIEAVALINIEGIGMIGLRGIAQRLFGALREEGIPVLLISQGSSGNSICVGVAAAQAEQARNTVEREFFAERMHGKIRRIEVDPGCSILAAVGEGMTGQPGIAAKFFTALGKAGISVRAIAQGTSERNISVAVAAADTQRALRAAHAGFYLSKQTISIGLIGVGNIGSTLLRQLSSRLRRLKEDCDIDFRVRALASSSRMLLSAQAIDLEHWKEELQERGEATDLSRLAAHVYDDQLPHAALIDCTASQSVAELYSGWLQRGIHVITPNKRANTSALEYYRRLRQANRTVGAHYLYETTVGAALPIIQTLRDLVQTGDEIMEIEGILSGTLSYLFNRFDGTRSFSSLVAEARALGYTEPDPRDDLSGTDVARKVVILAREIGLHVELPDVQLEGLVPTELTSGCVSEFLAALPKYDAMMELRRCEAAANGDVLRFVGRVDRGGSASVALRAYPITHPFARIQLTDNIVLFRTSRYNENPLVVQGPGAGPEVTAAGVFADLLRLASYLGASL